MSSKLTSNHTILACFLGYIVQAIVNNFAPLLFLTFQSDYGVSLEKIALLTTVNFSVQLITDAASAKFVDKIGYRAAAVLAHGLAAAGLILMAVLPDILPPFAGLLLASAVYAVGGGLLEVIISPIVESCPSQRKEAAMSLLHSFYCWGHLAVVLLSTLFFALRGVQNWKVLAVCWAAVPVLNLLFFLRVPMYAPTDAETPTMRLGELFRLKIFWVLMLLMVCAGASEQALSQWASAFAESALHVSKTVGDLVGPCTFALCMGAARALYAKLSDRLPLTRYMTLCGVLCIASYLIAATGQPVLGMIGCGLCGFSVGVLWPGTFSTAAKALSAGGTAMYAMLALAGDVGCSAGPTFVGTLAGVFDEDLRPALVCAVIFPLLLIAGLRLYKAAVKEK